MGCKGEEGEEEGGEIGGMHRGFVVGVGMSGMGDVGFSFWVSRCLVLDVC